MGVDVGSRLHVAVREHLPESERDGRESPLWFAGIVGWDDLDGLMERFNIRHCVIDGNPEAYTTRQFALRHRSRTWLAYCGRRESGTRQQRGESGDPHSCQINRTEAMDAVMQRVRDGLATLPSETRGLGGLVRPKDGFGEYYP